MLLCPGIAAAATSDAVTMFSDGDYIGGGEQRLYTPANASISVGGSTSYLTVTVSGGTRGDAYDLDFAAPPGQVLVPGVYDKAQRAPFREAGRPGIDISGDGRGCNEVAGRFEVKAFSVSSAGTLEQLWIVYEHHCEGGGAALFGEVRLGVPGPSGAAASAPSVVRWPAVDLGGAGSAVPVTVVATSTVQIGPAAITGADAGAFSLRLDDCSGRTLEAGGTCEVWVRFTPSAPGTRQAALRIPAGGAVHETVLQGFSYGGVTRVHMRSDPGDYIGQGQTWDYSAANARIGASGSRQGVGFGLDSADGDWWYATFVPGQGDILVPGATYSATRSPFNGTGPGMSVDGEGRGCNELSGTFKVTDLRFEADGTLRSVGIDFEQHCEHMTPALRGSWEYRKGDTTPLPPWMIAGLGSYGPPVQIGGSLQPPARTPSGAPPASQPPAQSTPAPPCTAGAAAELPLRRGSRRADRLRGTRRAERILAGPGADRISAGGGRDCVNAGAGTDRVRGGRGADLLFGAGGADVLLGGARADALAGGAGGDRLAGGGGRDELRGGPGDDVLDGGPGTDRLDCGRGRVDVARGVVDGERVSGCERVTRARR
jgi:hypothetical protein